MRSRSSTMGALRRRERWKKYAGGERLEDVFVRLVGAEGLETGGLDWLASRPTAP